MDRIQRTSHFFKRLFQLLFIALPFMTAIFWYKTSVGTASMGYQLNEGSFSYFIGAIPHSIKVLHALSPAEKILGFCISLIPLTIELLILYFLIGLFHSYENAKIFTLQNVQRIKKIGYTLLIGQLLHPFYQVLLSIVLTWHNPHGERVAVISLSGTNVSILLTGFMIILISWIMAEAKKLQDEQQFTI